MISPSWRRRLWTGVRFTIGLTLLYFAVRDVELGQLVKALMEVQAAWFGLVLVTIAVTQGLKALRWYLLLRPVVSEASPLQALGVLLVGQAGNILLPLRGGDVIRGWLGAGEEAEKVPAVATGLVLEKGLDAVVLAAGIALAVPLLPAEAELAVGGAQILAVGLALLALAAAILTAQPALWPSVRTRVGSLPLGGRIIQLGDRFVEGLEAMRGAEIYRAVLLLTVLSWISTYGTNQGLIEAMQLPAPLSAGLVVMVLVFVGIIPGLMPGQVGPFYFFARLALEQYGIPPQSSAAYAVLLHALYLLPPLLGAGVYLLSRAVQGTQEARPRSESRE